MLTSVNKPVKELQRNSAKQRSQPLSKYHVIAPFNYNFYKMGESFTHRIGSYFSITLAGRWLGYGFVTVSSNGKYTCGIQ